MPPNKCHNLYEQCSLTLDISNFINAHGNKHRTTENDKNNMIGWQHQYVSLVSYDEKILFLILKKMAYVVEKVMIIEI